MKVWLCVLVVALAAAQPPVRAARLPLRNYRSADGLPHDRVKSIFRDSRGFLWFCTVEGLGRFDGHQFERYRVDDGLPSQSINDIIEESPGVYWIASNGGGISRFDADRRTFTSFRIADSYLSNRVNTIRLDRHGRLWAGTDLGLFWLDPRFPSTGSHQEELPAESGFGVTRLLMSADGSLWIGSQRGLTRRWPGGAVRSYRLTDDGRWPVRALIEDAAGRLWVGGNRGLFVFRPENGATPPPGPVVLPVRHATSHIPLDPEPGAVLLLDGAGPSGALLLRPGGALWIGTMSGALLEFDGTRFRRYERAHGLGDSDILALEDDAEHNLWIGTYSAGAFRLARFGMVTYGTADGLPNSAIAGLIEDRSGRLVAATYDGALSRLESGRFAPLRLPFLAQQSFLGDIWQQFMLQSRTGDWWLRTQSGAFHLRAIGDVPSAVVEDFGLQHALPHRAIQRIYEDRRGRIWIGLKPQSGGDSLAVRDGEPGLRVFGAGDGLPPSGWPSAFGEDRLGDLWIGFSESGGLARYRNGRFERWTTADGVPAGMARAILTDRRDRLWVAFDAGGLCRITQEPDGRLRFDRWTTARGLASNNTRALAEDAAGRIYVGTELGVDRLDTDARTIRHYTTSDGLASNEVDVALAAHDGSLWFGTYSGLSRLSPELDYEKPPPPVWIRGVRVADRPIPVSALGAARVVLPPIDPGEDRFDIEFGSVEFGSTGASRYEYRLEGIDREWQSGPVEHRVTYARLGAGQYRFQVRAINDAGVHSQTPAVVEFAVRPPVWRRPWFLAMAAALAALSAYAWHRQRLARLLELERVRLRIAVDLHDDIGASLSQIAILSEVARRQAAGGGRDIDGPLARVAATSREAVDAMSDIVWAINPQRDSLDDLTRRMRRFASDMLASRGVRLRFVAPPDGFGQHLEHDVRRQLLLVFKESVTNVARHADASDVGIVLAVSRESLTLTVRDNGRGFDANAIEPGHGVANIRRRVESLGGTVAIDSSPGAGTEISAVVPCRPRVRFDYLRR